MESAENLSVVFSHDFNSPDRVLMARWQSLMHQLKESKLFSDVTLSHTFLELL
jgi:hypothetical protein